MVVSAVIVNLNQREKLLECVRSVEAALDRVEGGADVTVVDNGSQDGSAEAVRAGHPAVRVIDAGCNLGFARAVNLGARASEGEWLLLLNNDATVEPEAVAELLRAAEGRPRVGSVAAQLRFADGSERINSAGFGVDRLGVAYECRLGEPADPPQGEPREVFGASAGAAIYRRAMLAELGGLDPSFFVYLEDVDLAWRARTRGWTACYAPAAVAHHHHSLTAGHGSPFKYFHVGRNRIRVLAKNAPTGHLLRYGLAIAVYDLAYCLFVLVADRSAAPIRGRLRGLREWRRYRQRPPRAAAEVLEPVRGMLAAFRRREAWTGRRR